MVSGDQPRREKISVIIPSFNSTATIRDCIQSVLATGYKPLEIVVVDDASTDNSANIVQILVDSNPSVIRLLRLTENRGPARARNAGAAVADGVYFFFLDSDAVMNFRTLDAFATRIEEADAVVGIYDPEPLNRGVVPAYKALVNHYFFSRLGVIAYEVFDSSRAGIRREVFIKCGGFDEKLGRGMDYENEEFGYRIHRHHRLLLDPAVSVRHHFPGFKKLTCIYFWRVALWMEIFFHRRRFESGGVTAAETGLSSGALLLSQFFFISTILFENHFYESISSFLTAVLFCVYLYGYWGFFSFVARYKLNFLILVLMQNFYFTCVIAFGAAFGLMKVLMGRSHIVPIVGTPHDV